VFGVSEDELPTVAQHLETCVAGVWIRTGLGVEHNDLIYGRMFIAILLEDRAMDGFRAFLQSATTASGAPSVVIVEPNDTLGLIIDQMTVQDALWIVLPQNHQTLGWLAIYRPEAQRAEMILHVVDGVKSRYLPIHTSVKPHLTGKHSPATPPFASRIALEGQESRKIR
jgi:hypothetical protein